MGLLVFVFDELFDADNDLRGQARALDEIAGELTIHAAGLPPEAQSIVAGLTGLRALIDRAAHMLIAAAGAFGRTAAAAKRADKPDLLDYVSALAALARDELPEALLRRQGRRRLARLRRELRRNSRLLKNLDDRRDAAIHSGQADRVKRLERDIRTRRSLLEKSTKSIAGFQRDLRDLRGAGRIKGLDERTLRALQTLAGTFGFKTAGAILSAREWQNAMRRAGNVPRSVGERARTKADTRKAPPAGYRVAGGPAAGRALGVVPFLGAVADVADAVNKARKAWKDPNAGNIAKATAAGLHTAGNVPGVGLLPDGAGYAIEGAVVVADHADDAVKFVKDKVPFL